MIVMLPAHTVEMREVESCLSGAISENLGTGREFRGGIACLPPRTSNNESPSQRQGATRPDEFTPAQFTHDEGSPLGTAA